MPYICAAVKSADTSDSRTGAVTQRRPIPRRDARGLAVKFYLADGTTTDVVAISLPAFFARTPEDLLAFNDTRRPDPATGAPDVERVGAYLAEHPEALPPVTAAMTHPLPRELCRRHVQQPARVRLRR